jgi:hypothetical protein
MTSSRDKFKNKRVAEETATRKRLRVGPRLPLLACLFKKRLKLLRVPIIDRYQAQNFVGLFSRKLVSRHTKKWFYMSVLQLDFFSEALKHCITIAHHPKQFTPKPDTYIA